MIEDMQEKLSQSPVWQELATFEGDVPAGWLVLAEDGCSMWTVTPDSAAFWISRKFKWVIPPPRKDNSAKIAELESAIKEIKLENATHNNEMIYNDRKLREMEVELAKLKENK